MNPDLVQYRLDRAEEALKDAELLLSENRLISTVNRLYYGMFYAVIALLETNDLSSSKHTGVRALFNQHFVKTGVISNQAGSLFNMLFNDRHKGDYSDYVDFTWEQVNEHDKNCRKCVDEIRLKTYEIMDRIKKAD